MINMKGSCRPISYGSVFPLGRLNKPLLANKSLGVGELLRIRYFYIIDENFKITLRNCIYIYKTELLTQTVVSSFLLVYRNMVDTQEEHHFHVTLGIAPFLMTSFN